jgi:DNA-binding NtrC family response regulator
MAAARVLVAEDEHVARSALSGLLIGEGFHVLLAEDGQKALSLILHEEPDAVLLDIRMPEMDGLAVLKSALKGGSDSAFLVMTAHGDSGTAIEAMKLGAFDYLTKPLDFEHLLVQLNRAVENRRMLRKASATAGDGGALRAVPSARTVGHSPAMQRVYKLIGQVAASDATVLVRGESGTGKELVVNAIHENSARSHGPLIKVNCAAIPETLLESELFGHEKGAFTNALYRRIGRFEEAKGGTLLKAGFARTLYYRLNVVTITLPALRERKQDIPAIVQHFVARGGPQAAITPAALALLCDHHWPGNVRELENTIARTLVLARSNLIDRDDVQLLEDRPEKPALDWTALVPLQRGWKDNLERLEQALIERALAETQGNKSKAAEVLGIHHRLLYEKLRQYGLEGK